MEAAEGVHQWGGVGELGQVENLLRSFVITVFTYI